MQKQSELAEKKRRRQDEKEAKQRADTAEPADSTRDELGAEPNSAPSAETEQITEAAEASSHDQAMSETVPHDQAVDTSDQPSDPTAPPDDLISETVPYNDQTVHGTEAGGSSMLKLCCCGYLHPTKLYCRGLPWLSLLWLLCGQQTGNNAWFWFATAARQPDLSATLPEDQAMPDTQQHQEQAETVPQDQEMPEAAPHDQAADSATVPYNQDTVLGADAGSPLKIRFRCSWPLLFGGVCLQLPYTCVDWRTPCAHAVP